MLATSRSDGEDLRISFTSTSKFCSIFSESLPTLPLTLMQLCTRCPLHARKSEPEKAQRLPNPSSCPWLWQNFIPPPGPVACPDTDGGVLIHVECETHEKAAAIAETSKQTSSHYGRSLAPLRAQNQCIGRMEQLLATPSPVSVQAPRK